LIMLQTELFPELDIGLGRGRGAGCARPIGRRTSQRRRMLRTRPRRPSTPAILSQIRTLMQDDIGNVTATLRRIERGALTQLQFQE
jgi:hypothetical protein